ncbi:MAG: glycine cleavage system protein H [Thermoanaerobaculia bacterium]|nr:Glycine cleavage system H protein [Thermoanaerobaculia bacterium]MCK6685156.1 glycine cleavage system protein H [Thermoanaerobaculia bacterium]
MNEHDFLTLDTMRSAEYLIAALYVLLFIPFWKFVSNSAPRPVMKEAAETEGGWFQVPADIFLDRGHAWMKKASDGIASIGLDEFAHRLIGPVSQVSLPDVGSTVKRGAPALRIQVDGKEFAVLSPVDGRVTAINRQALDNPASLGKDPYGSAWLFRVKPEGPMASFKELLSGEKARKFLDDAFEALLPANQMSGALAQDGGLPASGFAREIDPSGWEALVRSQLTPEERRLDHERTV